MLANRVYARFGVAGAALLLPIVYLGGFGLWLVAFSFSTAAIFRFAQQVTQRGVSNAAWSAFYNVVPRERRAQVLAFNDGVPGQVGTILSGLLLLAAGSLFARDQVFWLGALTALLCTLVVAGIRRRYGASVLDSLRAGLGEQVLEGGPGLGALTRDPTATDTLIGALRSRRARRATDGGRPSRPDVGRASRAGAHPDRRRRRRSRRSGRPRSRPSAGWAVRRPRWPPRWRAWPTPIRACARRRSGRSVPCPPTRRRRSRRCRWSTS